MENTTEIHWGDLPEQRDGNLTTVRASDDDYTVTFWIMGRGIREAWVYFHEGNRYMAYYNTSEPIRREPLW
jgi:hypothetical protein